MKLLIIAVILLFSVNIYGSEELDFSSYYLAGNDSIVNVDHSASSVETISEGQYIMGGVFGTVIGYGIGHAMQGRWTKTGWIHTTFQVSGLAILVGGYFGLFPAFSANTSYIIGSIVFIGSKIWEIVDLWSVPSSMKVVSQKGLHIAPALYSQYNQGRFLGMKLQYNF